MLALYIGCNRIYLLGVDHTVFNIDNGRYDYQHFYNGQEHTCGELPEPPDLESEFYNLSRLWHQYKIL